MLIRFVCGSDCTVAKGSIAITALAMVSPQAEQVIFEIFTECSFFSDRLIAVL